tara:strand:- start:63 stop:500 length:438 start_codon:yes stop_codon:yes gene_type:complete
MNDKDVLEIAELLKNLERRLSSELYINHSEAEAKKYGDYCARLGRAMGDITQKVLGGLGRRERDLLVRIYRSNKVLKGTLKKTPESDVERLRMKKAYEMVLTGLKRDKHKPTPETKFVLALAEYINYLETRGPDQMDIDENWFLT